MSQKLKPSEIFKRPKYLQHVVNLFSWSNAVSFPYGAKSYVFLFFISYFADKLNTNIKRSLVDGLLEIRNGSIVIVLFSCRCISKTLRVQKTTIYTCVVSVSFVP